MGNWFSINQGTSIDFGSEVDGEPSIAVRITNESESHEPAIPKQLKSSPAEFNEQNILEEKKYILEIAVRIPNETESHEPTIPKQLENFPAELNEQNILEEKKHILKKTNGHDSCRTYPKLLETSLLTNRQPSPIFRASNDFYQNENIRRERSNSDAANSLLSKNKDGILSRGNYNRIWGDNNILNNGNTIGRRLSGYFLEPFREKMDKKDLRSVRIPNESESHEPAITKQFKCSPGELNEQNFLEETKQIMEIVRIPNESESHEPAIPKLFEIYPSNFDAANSMPSKNKDGMSFISNHNSIRGDDNRIDGSRNLINGSHNIISNRDFDQHLDHDIYHHRQRPFRNFWETLRETMVLNDSQLKGVVSPEAIFEVAKSVGADWIKLGESLHFSQNELDILDREHKSEGAGEICYLLLENWRETLASEATYWVLGNALDEIGRHDVVEILRSMSDD